MFLFVRQGDVKDGSGWGPVRGWRARRSLRREVRRRERAYQRQIKVDQKAQWLDMVRPGWARLVDPDVLNMWSGTQCVLGQVFSDRAASIGSWTGFGYAAKTYREETASMVFIGNRYREAWMNAIAQREQGDPREDHTGQKALREVIPSEARFTLPQ